MDIYRFRQLIPGIVQNVFDRLRGTGRSSRMGSGLKAGDLVVFTTHGARRLFIRDFEGVRLSMDIDALDLININGVYFIVCPVMEENNSLNICAKAKGVSLNDNANIIFDHEWEEEFIINKISSIRLELEQIERVTKERLGRG